MQRVAERAPAREDERDDDGGAHFPERSRRTASLNVIQRAAKKQCRARPESSGRPRRASAAGSRSTPSTSGEAIARPRARARRRRRLGPSPGSVAGAPEGARADAATKRSSISLLRREGSSTASAPVACSDSRTSVTRLEEPRLLARVDGPRLRQVHLDDARDAARPRRHDHDPRRQEHRLGDRVGDEDHRRARSPPRCGAARRFRRSRVISSSAPNGSSMSRSAGENESARAIDDALLHAARELPGVVLARTRRARRAPASPDARPRRSLRSQPSISRGSAMLRATVRQSYSTGSWNTIP